ncbi:MAG: dihydropteroate synthase [Proteobacteria bacterium]|nr:MAG: dihydropteroate synthase [Pseudomonadota bacterium]
MRSPVFPPDRVTVMGVVNVTPDSFSDGGAFWTAGSVDVEAAVAHALALERDGAHVLDVGGESTRPGAATLDAAAEVARVLPVIEALAKSSALPISVDTRKAAVARAALAAGARIVNDVSGGLHDSALLCAVAERDADLVIGHLRGEPATMQSAPRFADVLAEVIDELGACVARAEAAGVAAARIAVDPGIGFGKDEQHNLILLANAGRIGEALGKPVLVGASRKAFLGRITGDPADRRDTATVAAHAIAVFAGANAIRVHDVGAGVRAAAVGAALRRARAESLR